MFLFLPVAVVTTATTTVVHSAYPQQPAVPPSYPAAPYQGYQPVAIQPQPGMPVAPYPAQYPPPYPMQPPGPPAYHETVAGKAAPSASSSPKKLKGQLLWRKSCYLQLHFFYGYVNTSVNKLRKIQAVVGAVIHPWWKFPYHCVKHCQRRCELELYWQSLAMCGTVSRSSRTFY